MANKKRGFGNPRLQKQLIAVVFVAILILQSFVPWLGYIPFGPLGNVTIIHITVIIAGVLLGPLYGSIIGGVWGILSIVVTVTQPNLLTPVFINPMVSLFPRILVGLFSALIFNGLRNRINLNWSLIVTAIAGTLTNTGFVLLSILLFASNAFANALGISESAVAVTFIASLGLNFVFEIIVAVIIIPIVSRALLRYKQ